MNQLPNNEFFKQIEFQNKEGIKKLFKDEIKISFLLKMRELIINTYKDIYIYYPNILNLSNVDIIRGADNHIDYDLCCHIIGIHKTNILFLSEEEKGKLQNDKNYQKKLCNQVYEHIKLRQFGSTFFREKQLMPSERFLYFTMGYDVFVLSQYLAYIVEKNIQNKNRLKIFYMSMLNEAFCILTLIENGLLLDAFPQCRNIIELYYKYLILRYNSSAMEAYFEFCEYEINYASFNQFDDKFLKKYNSFDDNKKPNIIDYLHYGWIDEIFDFNYLGNDKKYSFVGLNNYINFKNRNNNDFQYLKDTHNSCHMLSHGSTISRTYPIESYFQLVHVLAIILKKILIDVCDVVKGTPKINSINLKNKFEKDMKDF